MGFLLATAVSSRSTRLILNAGLFATPRMNDEIR
jgi:hypothetical protein